MKDFEAFPHSALVFKKTCNCCGKTIFWQKSWRVLWGMSKEGFLCLDCADSKEKAESWFRQSRMKRRQPCLPEGGCRMPPMAGETPLMTHMQNCGRKDYKYSSYHPGIIKHIGFGGPSGVANSVTLLLHLETTKDLEEFIDHFPEGKVVILHTKDGKIKSISFGD